MKPLEQIQAEEKVQLKRLDEERWTTKVLADVREKIQALFYDRVALIMFQKGIHHGTQESSGSGTQTNPGKDREGIPEAEGLPDARAVVRDSGVRKKSNRFHGQPSALPDSSGQNKTSSEDQIKRLTRELEKAKADVKRVNMLTKPQRDKLYQLAKTWMQEQYEDDAGWAETAFVEYLNSLVPAPLPLDKAKEVTSETQKL